jgi:hypothetical protein
MLLVLMSVHLGKPPLLFAIHVDLNTGTSEVSTSPRRLEKTDDPGRERESTPLIGQQIKNMAATRVQQIEGGAMRELDVVNESQYVKSESSVYVACEIAVCRWNFPVLGLTGTFFSFDI